MDIELFKKILDTEPRSQDPEFLAARRGDLELARIARDAEAFEEKLERALRLPVPPDLARRVLDRVDAAKDGGHARAGRWWPVRLAAAATLALAVSLAVLRPDGNGGPRSTLAQAFVEHLHHREPRALASEIPLDPSTTGPLLAQAGLSPAGLPGNITYLNPCVIDDTRGLHLVATDADRGKVTLMYVPGRRLAEVESFIVDGEVRVRVFPTSTGAAAVFAHDGQDVGAIAEALRAGAFEGLPGSV